VDSTDARSACLSSTFTLLFQDDRGGLELRDPASGEFVHAEPEEGALVLNIGDMLQRFTNGTCIYLPFLYHVLFQEFSSIIYRDAD